MYTFFYLFELQVINVQLKKAIVFENSFTLREIILCVCTCDVETVEELCDIFNLKNIFHKDVQLYDLKFVQGVFFNRFKLTTRI